MYVRLSDDRLLSRCLKGKTQNQNESLHSRIWTLCPKVVSVSKAILDFAVAQSCLIYNNGYEKGSLCKVLGIPELSALKNILKKWDELRESHLQAKEKENSAGRPQLCIRYFLNAHLARDTAEVREGVHRWYLQNPSR